MSTRRLKCLTIKAGFSILTMFYIVLVLFSAVYGLFFTKTLGSFFIIMFPILAILAKYIYNELGFIFYLIIMPLLFTISVIPNTRNHIIFNYFSTNETVLYSKINHLPRGIKSLICYSSSCRVITNDSAHIDYPLNFPPIISIGACDLDNCIENYDSYMFDNGYAFKLTKNHLRVFPSIDEHHYQKYVNSINRAIEIVR